jgi:hypothetical protein
MPSAEAMSSWDNEGSDVAILEIWVKRCDIEEALRFVCQRVKLLILPDTEI